MGWSYGDKPTFVLTSRNLPRTRDTVEFYSGDLSRFVNERLPPAFRSLGRGWYGQTPFVDVWDLGLMKRIGRYKTKDGGTLTSFSFDNSLLAVEGSEKVTIWSISNGKQVGSVRGDGIMQFSPKAMELAVTDGDSLIVYVLK